MNFAHAPGPAAATELLRAIAARAPVFAARRVDKPLALYGAGNLGRMALAMLGHLGLEVHCVIDRQADRQRTDPFWAGQTLLRPDQVDAAIRQSHLLAVAVVTQPYAPIAAELAAQGWRDIVPLYDIAEAYRERYPLGNGWVLEHLDAAELEATAQVLAGWDDDRSRAHHLQFIAWHRLHQEWRFADAPVTSDDRYFIPEVRARLGQVDTFLDVGAHHGEVTQRFIAERQGDYRRIWMIEPDPANRAQLEAWLATQTDDRRADLTLLGVAAAAAAGHEPFCVGLGYASQRSTLGTTLVETRPIDALGLDPALVKLHLEGWELDALKGAEATLARARPLVVATTYHDEKGVWQTPQWLMRWAAERGIPYRFLYRLHGWCGTGGVMYALPPPAWAIAGKENTRLRRIFVRLQGAITGA